MLSERVKVDVGGVSRVSDLDVGQETMAGSLPVAIASDQGAVAVKTASSAIASGAVASGAIASGAIASGAIASGAVASGAIASGAVASGAIASGAIVDGADVTQGAKADARSTATDTTAVTIMSVLKEISYMAQNPASPVIKGAGFSVQVDLTVDAGAYSIGDAAGAMMTFAGVVSAAGKRGIINTITLAPNDALPAIAFNLWFLNADLVTPVAKNAAFTIVAADGPKILGIVPITAADYIPSQTSWNVATLRGVGLEFTVPATSLYAYLVCTAVTAPVATHLYITISGEMLD
jgi:hypothetical protein